MSKHEEWLSALSTEDLAKAYPTLLPTARAIRRWWVDRDTNGLNEANCVRMTRSHELRWVPDRTIAWYLRLEQ